MLPMRSNQDKVLNAFGNRLLHLCKETCLRIINGRCGDDKNLGKFTCYNCYGPFRNMTNSGIAREQSAAGRLSL